MKSIFCLLLGIVLAFSCELSAQEDHNFNNNVRKFGLSLYGNSVLGAGLSFDAFLGPNINLEVAGTLLLSYGGEAGINIFPLKQPLDTEFGTWAPYTGLHAGSFVLDFLTRTDYQLLYIPIGFTYVNDQTVTLAIDAGYSLQQIKDYRPGAFDADEIHIRHLPFGRLKLMFRF
jgi:hypothetical protein